MINLKTVGNLDQAKLYWQKQLSGDLPTLELPLDYWRYPAQPSSKSSESFALEGNLYLQLVQLSVQENVPSHVILLAAYYALLFRYSGQEDIRVGSLLDNSEEELGESGPNPLVLRTFLKGEMSVQTLIKCTAQTVAEALTHGHYPFAQLVRDIELRFNSTELSLFRTMFLLSNPPPAVAANGHGLDYQAILGGSDIVVYSRHQFNRIDVTFAYNTALFKPTTIRRLLGHYYTLLQGILANSKATISNLPLLSPGEREQIVVGWNQTQVNYPPDLCLHHLFEAQVTRSPNATALIFPASPASRASLSYQQLNQQANQLAHHLQTLGVGPDTIVGVLMHRSLDLVIALYAILKAGGAYLPLDPDYPPDRLAFMLNDAQPSVLLTQNHLTYLLPPLPNTSLIPLDTSWPNLAHLPTHNPSTSTTPHNLAYVIYTSGSTGRPKGVLNSHRGICNRLLWMQDYFQLNPNDRVLQKTPFSFDVSVWEFFWPLFTGAQLVIAQPGGHKDSAYLIQLINQFAITTLHFVPSMLHIFLDDPAVSTCLPLSRVICSGEALPFDLQERFFAKLPAQLHNLYGPTEAAVDVTYWTCQPNSQRHIVPIGFPVANTQMYILDPQLQPVPIGVLGELHIGGCRWLAVI